MRDGFGAIDVAAWHEEAHRQLRLSGPGGIAEIGIQEHTLTELAKVSDDPLVAVIDQRVRVDLDRTVPFEEMRLVFGSHRSCDPRADHEQQIALARGD